MSGRYTHGRAVIAVSRLGLFAGWLVYAPQLGAQQRPHGAGQPSQGAGLIPASVRAEHEEIHRTLDRLTTAPGPVSVAAQDLQRILAPHFQREEQIALPPLGLLRSLVAGTPPQAVAALVRPMADSLRVELPRMLAEHQKIAAAVGRLEAAGHCQRDSVALAFAVRLRLHAQQEEEVMYPAAILVGDVLRRGDSRRSKPAR